MVPPEPDELSRSYERFEQRRQEAKKRPFLDTQPMIGSPPCSWTDFRRPLLRRFHSNGKIHWKKQLGYGVDGIVWKAEIDERIFAIKVFWDNEAPEGAIYWAVQRECHNAALLQMIQSAITDSTKPIYLRPEPKTFKNAVTNLYAFSDEGRCKQPFKDDPLAIPYTDIPPLRQCFGWTKITGKELYSLPRPLWPCAAFLDRRKRQILPSEEYYAIVYEYVPTHAALDKDVVQAQLDFFWRAGFCFEMLRKDNWKGKGVLIDRADLICPWHMRWKSYFYERHFADPLCESGTESC